MTLMTNGWRAAMTLVAACAAVAAFAGPVWAQATISFTYKDYFSPGANVTITVSVPAAGRIVSPRFHYLREGEPLPKNGSRGGLEFPELTGNQELTIRAPQEEGEWWLVLFDGKKLVARTTFDVFDIGTVLELKHRDICSKIKTTSGTVGDGCERHYGSGDSPLVGSAASAPPPTEPPPTEPPDPAASPTRLRLLSKSEIQRDGRVDVAVSDSNQTTRALELRWAKTAGLPFARKQLAPFTGPAFPVSTGQPSTTITAPGEAGRYDVLLFADGELLEALPVSVQ